MHRFSRNNDHQSFVDLSEDFVDVSQFVLANYFLVLLPLTLGQTSIRRGAR